MSSSPSLAEGFRCFTLADIAERLCCSKRTLYSLGHSKEQLTVNVVVHFFRGVTQQVEAGMSRESRPAARVVAYLQAVARELRPASPAFMADLAAHPATNAVYEQNTAAAARRLGTLIDDGITAGVFRPVHGAFVADVIASTLQRIQTGSVLSSTGLSDADAFDELAALILTGISTDAALDG